MASPFSRLASRHACMILHSHIRPGLVLASWVTSLSDLAPATRLPPSEMQRSCALVVHAAFATLAYYPDDDVLDRLAEHAASIIQTFRPQATSNTLWAFAKLAFTPCKALLEAAAQQIVCDLGKSVPQVRAVLAARICKSHPQDCRGSKAPGPVTIAVGSPVVSRGDASMSACIEYCMGAGTGRSWGIGEHADLCSRWGYVIMPAASNRSSSRSPVPARASFSHDACLTSAYISAPPDQAPVPCRTSQTPSGRTPRCGTTRGKSC